MKALIKYDKGPGKIEIRDIAEPICQENQVKIKIRAAGVCGTDVHIYEGNFDISPPVVLGHEFSGEIIEIGKNVTGVNVGDRVTAENVNKFCGKCYLCNSGHYAICPDRKANGINMDGAFTKYIVIDEKFVFSLPDNITYEEGALSEPLTCCTHAVLEQTKIIAGDIVLVSGPGSIGLITLQLALVMGATVIVSGTEVDKDRLKLAKDLGANFAINIEKDNIYEVINKITDGKGVDVVIECSGAQPAVNMGLDVLRKRGQYTQLGLFGKQIKIDFEKVCWKEIKLTGSMSHSREAWLRAIMLVKQNKINLKALITHDLSILEWEKAFENHKNHKAIKTILKPIE